MEVKTKDSVDYSFYPVNIFRMCVSVKAAHDASVSFTSGECDTIPMVEFIFGGWQNTKSAIRIRLDNENVDMATEETPEMMTADEYRDFTLEWAQNGRLFQLYGGADRTPFLSWKNLQCPFPVTHFGVRTTEGAIGDWICDGMNCMGTANSANYNYNLLEPVCGRLELKLRAGKNAHVCLASGPSAEGPIHEIFLGEMENNKCSIVHNQISVAESDTPGLLSDATYENFWIEWGLTSIKVGIGNSPEAFLEWASPVVLTVTHFGIRTVNGSEGSWTIPSQGASVTTGQTSFGEELIQDGIRAEEEAERVRLEAEAERIRQEAEAERIRRDAEAERNRVEADANHKREAAAEADRIQREAEANKFRRHAEADRIRQEAEAERLRRNAADADRIRREAEAESRERDAAAIRNRRHAEADRQRQEAEAERLRRNAAADQLRPDADADRLRRDADANRVRRQAEADRRRQEAEAERNRRFAEKSGAGDGINWVPSTNGRSIPPGAVVGGQDGGEPIYVARGHHERDLIPGKLVPSHGVAYVAYGGKEHGKNDFEVLVAAAGSVAWVASSAMLIPDNAIPGGHTENRETLFIGRVPHCSTVTTGKIHPSHGTLYIPYGGLEIGFPEYEILVRK